MKIAVLGGGSWGTALAHLMGTKGYKTAIWVREPHVLEQINTERENKEFLPGIKFPDSVTAVADAPNAIEGADLILLVVPTQYVRAFVGSITHSLPQGIPIVLCSKGIEKQSLRLGHEILAEELPPALKQMICVLSGPSFAREVAMGQPTNVTIAAEDENVAKAVQQILSTRTFRPYTSTDMIGVEMGGACKNVLAIASGAATGLGYGYNAQAGLITRGLAEMTRLAVKKGANPLTMSGLSGMGDLVLTCTGELSRNRMVGYKLAQGMTMKALVSSMNMVAEGIDTSKSLYHLAATMGVDMPITTQVYRVLHEGVPVAEAVTSLLARSLKEEINLQGSSTATGESPAPPAPEADPIL